jgi:DNA-binding NarL/FixJ family response regulator
MSNAAWKKHALIVHPNLATLSSYQTLLSRNDIVVVAGRDLPTTLLAITQHHFDMAIVSSQIAESGDGWTLAGVIKMAFPRSFIAVLVPGQDLLTLQAAINHGVQEVYDSQESPDDVIRAILSASGERNQAASIQARVGQLQ